MDKMAQRVQNYWTARAHSFGIVKRNELKGDISRRWIEELNRYLPKSSSLDILDVGTGTGYFAILLSKAGHRVTGIDLTPSMLEEARASAAEHSVSPQFLLMDAQETDFHDESFDVIVTRNLTWTLPDPEKAYGEWLRVLRPGGIILNFDANYAENVRNHNQSKSYIAPSDVYGHIGVTAEMERENAEITLSMPASLQNRPAWDMDIMCQLGFEMVSADICAGKNILKEHDLSDAPMFLISGRKQIALPRKNL